MAGPNLGLVRLAKMKAKYPTATVYRVVDTLFWRMSTAQKEANKQDTSVTLVKMAEYVIPG